MTIERLLDSLDRLVAHAAEVLGREEVERAARLARNGRRRIGYLGDGLVVALAGGTGSGKSSLLNAIAGENVTASGPIRPTTSQALAWAPAVPEPGIVRLLDDMGVTDVVAQGRFPHLTILDMPDTDSVVGSNRGVFQALLPRVDAVVWVVDPEKYNDRIIHEDYLSPLAPYRDQFVFVFNQTDRLTDSELEDVIADFTSRLRIDGIHDPVIVPTAAAPTTGPPRGIDRLMDVLEARLDAKQIVVEKVAIDTQQGAAELAELVGLGGEPVGFDERWQSVKAQATAVLGGLVAGGEVEEIAARSGRLEGRRRAAGPLTALATTMRDSPIGRLLGFQDPILAVELSTAHWNRRAGLEAVYSLLERFVGDIAADLGGRHGIKLRNALPGAETASVVQRVVDRALIDRPYPDLNAALPRWLGILGVLKWLLAGAFVAGALWWWAVPVSRGEWPWPVILMLGSVVAGLLATRTAEGIGARGGRYRTRQFRRAVEEQLSIGFDREFGAVMRSFVRDKAELAAKVDEVRLLADATLSGKERVEA